MVSSSLFIVNVMRGGKSRKRFSGRFGCEAIKMLWNKTSMKRTFQLDIWVYHLNGWCGNGEQDEKLFQGRFNFSEMVSFQQLHVSRSTDTLVSNKMKLNFLNCKSLWNRFLKTYFLETISVDGKSITIRDCAVDSGSLTADTEIIRLQNALGFFYPLALLLMWQNHYLREQDFPLWRLLPWAPAWREVCSRLYHEVEQNTMITFFSI